MEHGPVREGDVGVALGHKEGEEGNGQNDRQREAEVDQPGRHAGWGVGGDLNTMGRIGNNLLM